MNTNTQGAGNAPAQPRKVRPSDRIPAQVSLLVTRRATGETMTMTVVRGAAYLALDYRRVVRYRDLNALVAALEAKHPDLDFSVATPTR